MAQRLQPAGPTRLRDLPTPGLAAIAVRSYFRRLNLGTDAELTPDGYSFLLGRALENCRRFGVTWTPTTLDNQDATAILNKDPV
jgi:hypothetical protein